ncbi:MAG: hypothetical protein D6743_05935 [Calditrichaeota bacterium]|nr:MAG: hypothetical protein D6743_05935 [Calditrichota bacterium]
MDAIYRRLLAAGGVFVLVLSGCWSDQDAVSPVSAPQTAQLAEHDRHEREHDREGHSEHDRDSGEHHGAEGEESGAELDLDETYSTVRRGVHLVLAYDRQSNSFTGTIENTTDHTLSQVRVEVHLSSGKELGPTTPVDLQPGEKLPVRLAATTKDFDRWSAHAEVGRGEHDHATGGIEHDQSSGQGHKKN